MKFFTSLYRKIVNAPFNEPIFISTNKPINSKIIRFIYDSILTIFKAQQNYVTSERIVEIPFVLQNLDIPKGGKILDFGCDESKISLELASLGYSVTAVDFSDYNFSHPNLKFIKSDILKVDIDKASFDVIVALSAIEHCGIGFYSNDMGDDLKIIKYLHSLLKKGGKLLITVPFGKKDQNNLHRIYDFRALENLLKDFNIVKKEFYIGIGRKHWLPCTEKDLENTDSIKVGFVQGVACIVCRKS